MRMLRIILSSVTCPALTCFFHVMSQTERFSGAGGVIENKMCVLCSSTNLSEKSLILRITQSYIIINALGSLRKVPVAIVRF